MSSWTPASHNIGAWQTVVVVPSMFIGGHWHLVRATRGVRFPLNAVCSLSCDTCSEYTCHECAMLIRNKALNPPSPRNTHSTDRLSALQRGNYGRIFPFNVSHAEGAKTKDFLFVANVSFSAPMCVVLCCRAYYIASTIFGYDDLVKNGLFGALRTAFGGMR